MAAFAVLAAVGVTPRASAQTPTFHGEEPVRVTGRAIREGAPLDDAMTKLLTGRNIAGGQLAIVQDGRPVYDRAFGWADFQPRTPVNPRDRFRVGQVSQLLTSATALLLVDRGSLDLNANPLAILQITPIEMVDGQRVDTTPDPKLAELTVAHLIRHRGGWLFPNRYGADPILDPIEAARTLRSQHPTERQFIELITGRPLDYAPGVKSAPSVFASVLLGETMHRATGSPAEDLTKRGLFAAARVRGPEVGTMSEDDEVSSEVHYYDARGRTSIEWDNRVAVAIENDRVTGRNRSRDNEREYTSRAGGDVEPLPYAIYDIELMGAGGGWVASASEIARAISALEFGRRPLLSEGARDWMLARPEGTTGNIWTAAGWHSVTEGNAGLTAVSTGSLSGTIAIVSRRPDGIVWCALFNTGSGDPRADGVEEITKTIDDAVSAVYGVPAPPPKEPED